MNICLKRLLIVAAMALPFAAGPVAAEEEEPEVEKILGKPKLEMAPFNFSVIKRGVVEGQASLHFVLVMDNTTDFEFVRSRLPQLRSDFNTALTILSRQHFNVNRPIDPDMVKAYLTPYLDHRLGQGKAQVFVKQALIHPN
ncbi:hypothetical protein [Kordiimonas aestuarii]|uniref:hypothetical protein n=1 Tax=Kordiimonas aestuarii TaxID=1005925 RepID=UPI0021D1EFF9|nr:hypothetical protein [Kordiimonas aestuarii]